MCSDGDMKVGYGKGFEQSRCFVQGQECVESSNCLRGETVLESGGGGTDVPVTSDRWHEGKKSMRGIEGSSTMLVALQMQC